MSLHVVCKKIEKCLKSEHKEGEEVVKGERESWPLMGDSQKDRMKWQWPGLLSIDGA